MATWLQIMKTKTEIARQNKRKKKKGAALSLFLFYYYFSWGKDLGLLSCSLQGSLICSLGVSFGRNWEACQNNFHYGILFIFWGGGGGAVLGSSWGHGGIKSNLLGHLSSFFIYPELLSHVWRTAGGAGTLLGLCFSRSATLGGAPVLELLKDEALMARG